MSADIRDVVGALLAKLERSYLGEHPDDVEFVCDGRDYDLVWDSTRGDWSIDATVWDVTDEPTKQLATLRFTIGVIA